MNFTPNSHEAPKKQRGGRTVLSVIQVEDRQGAGRHRGRGWTRRSWSPEGAARCLDGASVPAPVATSGSCVVATIVDAIVRAGRATGHRPVAADLGVPAATVRGWLRRARRDSRARPALARMLDEVGGHSPRPRAHADPLTWLLDAVLARPPRRPHTHRTRRQLRLQRRLRDHGPADCSAPPYPPHQPTRPVAAAWPSSPHVTRPSLSLAMPNTGVVMLGE
jgi:hypothetical protein